MGENCCRNRNNSNNNNNNNPVNEVCSVKFLNFRTPENFAVTSLKFKQRGQTVGNFVKKVQME